MRTTIYLDDEVYEELRERAHHTRVTMAALIRTAVDEYLAKAPPPAAGYTPTWTRKRGY